MRKLSRKAGLTEMKKAGKQRLFIAAGILILAVTGCGRKTQENHDNADNKQRSAKIFGKRTTDKEYNLHTVDGTVDVVRGYYQYVNGRLERGDTVRYPVDSWEYTKKAICC